MLLEVIRIQILVTIQNSSKSLKGLLNQAKSHKFQKSQKIDYKKGQGDCDSDDECEQGLTCARNSCSSLLYGSKENHIFPLSMINAAVQLAVKSMAA